MPLGKTSKTRKKKGTLFIVSAPSGCGKTTLCNKLLQEVPRLLRSVSFTTRVPRRGEQEGIDYHFVSVEKFNKLLKKKKFVEHARVFGNLYGTPAGPVKQALNNSKDILLSVDVKGAAQIKKVFGPQSVFIFILPPSFATLRRRLTKRHVDSKDDINKRLKVAKRELSYLPGYDYVVVNRKLKNAASQLKKIIITRQRMSK